MQKNGMITRIAGPVLDVRFQAHLPEINELLISESGIHMEVAAHISTTDARCIALDPTDGLLCGESVNATGGCITVPVGETVLGPSTPCAGASTAIHHPLRKSTRKRNFLKPASR